MKGSEKEERQEEICGWKRMFKNSLYLKEQGSTLLKLYACTMKQEGKKNPNKI